MQKPVVIIITILIIVSIGAFLFFSSSSNNKPSTTTGSTISNENIASDEVMGKNPSGSRYLEYSKNVLDDAKDTRRVLFFYASWCPTCRPADQSFKENLDKIPQDAIVIRVNYNDPETDQEEKDLAKKYGITYQHTYVQIDSYGNEATKWNGGKIDELLTNIK